MFVVLITGLECISTSISNLHMCQRKSLL